MHHILDVGYYITLRGLTYINPYATHALNFNSRSCDMSRQENGREKSHFVWHRIPFLSVLFLYLQEKTRMGQKRDGILREQERKWFNVFPSVFPKSHFYQDIPVFPVSRISF
jgi:hypothetical protein